MDEEIEFIDGSRIVFFALESAVEPFVAGTYYKKGE